MTDAVIEAQNALRKCDRLGLRMVMTASVLDVLADGVGPNIARVLRSQATFLRDESGIVHTTEPKAPDVVLTGVNPKGDARLMAAVFGDLREVDHPREADPYTPRGHGCRESELSSEGERPVDAVMGEIAQ